MKILIVDDNPDDRRVLRYLTERHGHQAVEAQNGLEALEKARIAIPDAIISDALMPVMDGYRFLRSVRQDEGLRAVPFVFYSASYKGDQDVRLALSLGADAYFVKPVDPVELWARIEGLLATKKPASGPAMPLVEEDLEYLKRYSEVVATKLEEKVRELEQALEEQRRTEAALRESETKFRSLAETSPAGIIIHQGGRYRYANAVFEAVTGFSREQILSMHFWDLVHPDFREMVRERGMARARGEPAPEQYEFKIVPKSGEERWVEIRAAQIDFEGQPAVLATLFDVTERKRAEESLRKLSRAVEQSPVSIVITDTSGTIEYVNPKFTEVTGYSPEEAVGKNPRILKSGEMSPDVYARMWQMIESGREWRGEFLNRKKSGELYWESASISPIRDTAGVTTHILAVKEDITERKRDQERIREQAALLDQTQDAVLVLGLDRRLRYGNRSAERSYGWTGDALLALDASTLLFQAHPERCAEVCQLALQRGNWSGELTHMTSTGVRRTEFSRWTLIHDGRGQPASFLIVNTDVTEQKRLEEQFLRTQRMESIGTLASGVAHDLNNILSPIMMSTGLLEPLCQSDEEREMVAVIEQCARRGSNIVKQLLTFGRGMEAERVAVQPRSLLKEMVVVIRETFPKNITVLQQVPADLWVVRGNPTQIHQILLNLCVNARDAMPGGGLLTIEAENVVVDEAAAAMNPDAKPSPYVVLHVGDTGTGIAPEIMTRIFDPFFTTKELGKGTGLGLSTVLGIVKSHGGFVQIDSQVGKGTHFRVYLPSTVDEGDWQAAASSPRVPSGHGELILVTDDEEGVRRTAQRMLERCGYRVVTAADGAEALLALSRSREAFRGVITDMLMPVMDGAALIRSLRRHSPHLALVGMSGLSEQEDVAVQAGIERGTFLVKPFSAEQLIRTLQKALGASSRL